MFISEETKIQNSIDSILFFLEGEEMMYAYIYLVLYKETPEE